MFVDVSRSTRNRLSSSKRGVLFSGAAFSLVALVCFSSLRDRPLQQPLRRISSAGSQLVLRNLETTQQEDDTQQCRFFLAESAIPRAGLGLYTAVDLKQGEPSQPMPDLCIYINNVTTRGNDFDTHSYAPDSVFNAQFEGNGKTRGACEGFATLWNSMPNGPKTSKLTVQQPSTKSTAGLHRATHAGAGAISQYFGATSETVRDVAAGSEITVDYGDFRYNPRKTYHPTHRSVDWIRQHGWCVDRMEIRNTVGDKGRGAFAKRALPQGATVAPAPVQTFHRSIFGGEDVESLFVNYCLEVPGTDILLYPYGPGVNLINHGSAVSGKANVALRWSQSSLSHSAWLELPLDEFWEMVYPGALILEVVALRDIAPGEELLLDYGAAWERAWDLHVLKWQPVRGAERYVYPSDLNTQQKPFRTLAEQQDRPYPSNLVTACQVAHWKNSRQRGHAHQWRSTKWEDWPTSRTTYCQILKRYSKQLDEGDHWGYFYRVAVEFSEQEYDAITPLTPRSQLYMDMDVPQSAIQFVERPYQSDMNLPNAFRQPMGLAEDLIPEAWRTK